jgi:hypothetical protein
VAADRAAISPPSPGLVNLANRRLSLAPPLVVTRDELDRMVTIADEALTIAGGEFAAEFEG